jgi:hypothetical protein
MDTLHDIFRKQCKKIVPRLAVEVISKKMAQQGVQLSKRQKESIATRLAESWSVNLKFHNWKFWDQRRVDLVLNKDDVDEIERQALAATNRLEEIIWPLTEEISELLLDNLKQRSPKLLRKERQTKRSFVKQHLRLWGRPIDLLSIILGLSQEFGEDINYRLRQSSIIDKKHSIEALSRLHARACQVASEIIILLSAGFADGAMARWRTLHEIAVTAFFLSDHGEPAAERYINHEIVESYHAARQYERFHNALGEEPIPDDELARMGELYRRAIERYGKEFSERYGWAASFLSNPKPGFVDIEQAVNVDYLRPYFRMASYGVHATPKGAFFKLGLIPESQFLLAGPSNFGLADPGRNCALTLAQVNSALLSLDCTFDSIVILKMISALSRQAADSFLTTQSKLETPVV